MLDAYAFIVEEAAAGGAAAAFQKLDAIADHVRDARISEAVVAAAARVEKEAAGRGGPHA